MDPVVIAFGLGVGVLIGLTGIGGGSLMTPLLVLFTGTKPVIAIGTDLAYGAITKTLGGWQHLRNGTVDLRLTGWLIAGSAPGSLLGVWLIERIHGWAGEDVDGIVLSLISGALALAALGILVRVFFLPHLSAKEADHADLSGRRGLGATAIGFVLGLILGATSVGSGALFGVAMILLYRLTPRRVVGTDVFHAAALLWVAGFAHFLSGNVNFALMGNILVGSIPGVFAGTHLTMRLHPEVLRPILAVVLLAAAIGVASKAGADIHPGAIVGIPLLAAGVMAVLARGRARSEAAAAAPPPPAEALKQ